MAEWGSGGPSRCLFLLCLSELDRRDFTYVEVFIRDFPLQPQLIGRRALVEFADVIVKAIDVASA